MREGEATGWDGRGGERRRREGRGDGRGREAH